MKRKKKEEKNYPEQKTILNILVRFRRKLSIYLQTQTKTSQTTSTSKRLQYTWGLPHQSKWTQLSSTVSQVPDFRSFPWNTRSCSVVYTTRKRHSARGKRHTDNTKCILASRDFLFSLIRPRIRNPRQILVLQVFLESPPPLRWRTGAQNDKACPKSYP